MEKNLPEFLAKAAKVKDPAERAVRIAAVLAQALRDIGQDPVLVGGAAVEFYTQGGYSTQDIDLLAPGGPELIEVMKRLGFAKFGKDFFHRKLKIYVEFPGASLDPQARFQEIRIGDQHLRIIALEDLIVDRLAAFKFWQSAIDGTNAILLMELENLDEARLMSRARQEKVADALGAVRRVREEAVRKNLDPKAGNQLLLRKMRELK